MTEDDNTNSGDYRTATVQRLPDNCRNDDKYEFKVECEETCHYGPAGYDDARQWWTDHQEMGHDVTVYVREKQGRNLTDLNKLPDNECDKCGSNNVPGQVLCAVCGGPVNDY